MIPFHGLDRQFIRYKDEFLTTIENTLSTGQVLQGKPVADFEKTMANLCRRKFAKAVGSCTDALAFALLACGVKPGDEVLVTSFSFVASASPILRVKAVPVFVDIDPDYFMMDLEDAKEKLTPKTRFLLAVHLFGQCLNMGEVKRFANEHHLTVIEDAAQALGSSDNGDPAGSLGEASCVSFDPTKVIGAFGSGGMVLTDSEKINEQVDGLRYHGRDPQSGQYLQLGYNSQLSSENAALLSCKLSHMDEWITARHRIAQIYLEGLAETEEVGMPKLTPGSTHNWHKFVIRSKQREQIRKGLEDSGIQAKIHYGQVLPDVPYMKESLARQHHVPVAREICTEVLSLPIYPELTEKEASMVIQAAKKGITNGNG